MSNSQLQLVLNSSSFDLSIPLEFHSSTLVLPFYVAIASCFTLLFHLVCVATTRFRKARNALTEPFHGVLVQVEPDGVFAKLSNHVSRLGGGVVFSFMLTRVLLSLVLTVASFIVNDQKLMIEKIALFIAFLYSSVLALSALVINPRWSRIVTRHFNVLMLSIFAVYAYRDIYPLTIVTGIPQDEAEGHLIWFKISLLAVLAIAIPLMIPRRYRPCDPKNPRTPSPEQTASILSLAFYFFMEPLIVKIYRTPQLPYNNLPPLPDYAFAEYLRAKDFQHIDPTIVVKKRSMFWSLMSIFYAEFIIMAASLAIQALAEFATPVAVNQLLSYLETGGEGAKYRPWIWVAFLLIGPTLFTVSVEWFLYIGTQAVVSIEALLTQVVFEHALRIRMKAETDSELSEPMLATPTPEPAPSGTDSSTGSNDENEIPQSSARTGTGTDTTLQASTTSAPGNLASNANKAVAATASSPNELPKLGSTNMAGKINNLVSTDLQNIVDAKDFVRLIVYTPIQVALCIFFLYAVLGWSAFVGLASILILFPIPGYLAKLVGKAQGLRMAKTDARVQIVTETMSVLRMVKMFGWENMMNKRITEKREDELAYIKRTRILNLFTILIYYITPIVTMLATYASYPYSTLVMKQELTASKVFSSMVVFEQFRNQLRMFTSTLNQAVTGKVSLDRITDFLYDSQLLDVHTDPGSVPPDSHSTNQDIGFRNAAFSWSNESFEGAATHSKRQFRLKVEDEVIFRRGCINLILGPTGSGKTSVLMALLSEMHFIPSGPDSWYNLPRDHGVAYAAQESWVQNATIKENIVFGAAFDEGRYKKVLYQCALERDLDLFEAGDETEVGEKGLTLSGGQKARVTLARAVYSRAEILLLDDVLAALDVHTSKWIIEKCFMGDLIEDRTVLLVTHSVVMVQPIAGFVIALKDGRVVSQGAISDALSRSRALKAEVEEEEVIEAAAKEEIDDGETPSEEAVGKKSDGKLIVAEEVELGHIGWPALKIYLLGLGGNHVSLFFFMFIGARITSLAFEIGQTWYLGHWASQYETHDPSAVNDVYYIAIYTLILLFAVVAFCMYFVVFFFGSLRASRSIHKQLVDSVLGTTLRWLDITPAARVIARSTQDMRDVDGPIPELFSGVIVMSLTLIAQFLAVVIFTPAFIGPSLLVAIMGVFCGQIYIKAQLPVKRIQANAKSPVLAHFGAAIAGLTSIRAYGAQESFKTESIARINHYSRPARVFNNLNRWIDVRIEAVGAVFSASLAAYLLSVGHRNAADTGFSINMAVAFSGGILWWIRLLNNFEVRGNSLERIKSYIGIEQEPKPTPEGTPPAYWPSSGDLRVEGLSARYSPDGPKVLKDISFHVRSGERIGVVGRTGSGKSSLVLSLLRCIYTEGEVYYDGIPTSSINLESLRQGISIIPQMPELLSGTIRRNLDPFSENDDGVLNDALRSVGMYGDLEVSNPQATSSSPSRENERELGEERIGLDTPVASGGANLSFGQRQIIALARAIVRGSKLLILDEATSAIDHKTDLIIQSSLRRELGRSTHTSSNSTSGMSGVTVITVAHRLQSVMDSDRVMVLDAGRIVELDTPLELLRNPEGKFRALVDASAERERERLWEVARANAGTGAEAGAG